MANNPNESQSTTNPQAGAGNTTASGANEEAKAIFKSGMVYSGVITSCLHGDQLYNVSLSGQSSQAQQCEWGAGIFCALLGFKTSMLPTVGTRVVVLGGQPPVIIGTLPVDPRDDTAGKTKIMTSTDAGSEGMKEGDSGLGVNHTYPSDLLEGEFEMGNSFGVALQFLTNLVKLQGSERAKVECHLLNDMVRIVSDTFKHYSSFGDYEIYNDGGLNVKFEGTSREHEAQGLMDEEDPKVPVGNNEVNFDAGLEENGRWRFSQYIGFLGDFIHVFVTDPSTVASNIGASMRAGKSRFWQGMDGTCLLQSVTEIAIERVVRIPAPQENKRWDDPEGVLKKSWSAMVDATKGFTEVWNYGEEYKDIHKATYQLREYARWMNCFHSYARFHQYNADSGEWTIPKETAIGHAWTNKESDVEETNTHLSPAYYDAYACIRIMRDGAIVLWDGYGSSVTMSRKCLQLSATRHVDIDAGGDVKITAGNDIYVRARRHVEIVATVGSIVTKARTAWKALCEWGSVWIKSDAQDPEAPDYSPPVLDDPAEDPAVELHDAAILLDTSKGRITVNSTRTLTLQTDASTVPDDTADHNDDSKSVLIQSQTQDVKVLGTRNANIKSTGRYSGIVSIDSPSEAIVLASPDILIDCNVMDINKRFTISNSGAIINAQSIKSNQLYVQNPIYGGKAGADISESDCCYVQHDNHVLLEEGDNVPEFAEDGDVTARTTYLQTVRPNFRYDSQFETLDPSNGPSWRFYSPAVKYDWQYGDVLEDRFTPLAQQRIEFDTALATEYKQWTLTNDTLKPAPRTVASDVPYPGSKGQELEHDSNMAVLHEPLNEEYKDQSPSIKTDMTYRKVERQFLKTSSNKPT